MPISAFYRARDNGQFQMKWRTLKKSFIDKSLLSIYRRSGAMRHDARGDDLFQMMVKREIRDHNATFLSRGQTRDYIGGRYLLRVAKIMLMKMPRQSCKLLSFQASLPARVYGTSASDNAPSNKAFSMLKTGPCWCSGACRPARRRIEQRPASSFQQLKDASHTREHDERHFCWSRTISFRGISHIL